MNRLIVSLSAAILLASTSVAIADEKSDLLDQFEPYVSAPGYFDKWGLIEAPRFDLDAAACLPIVEKMRALGIADNDRFPGYMDETWRFKQAPGLCERYRTYQLRIRAGLMIDSIGSGLERESFDSRSVEYLGECVTVLDKLVADGLPANEQIDVRGKKVVVGDIRNKCTETLEKAKQQVAEQEKEAAASKAAETAMWAKLGVSGERLKILRSREAFYIKGCENTSDPKKLAKAKVVRIISGNYGEPLIYVKSWHFKGNSVTKSTDVTWASKDMSRACK